MTVDRITFHHEGAGSPSDNVDRFLSAGYSIGIGQTLFKLARPPEQSFKTVGQGNRHSLQVCFSGNRDIYPLRDNDLRLVRMAIAEARSRGWVTRQPEVFLHNDTMRTVCPGRRVEARRADLTAAVTHEATTPVEEDDEMPLSDHDFARIQKIVHDEVVKIWREQEMTNLDVARARKGSHEAYVAIMRGAEFQNIVHDAANRP